MTEEPTVSTTEAAEQLDVSKVTITRMFKDGQLSGYKKNPQKLTSPIRIYQSSIDEFLEQRSQ